MEVPGTARIIVRVAIFTLAIASTGPAAAWATPPDAELVTVTSRGFIATWTTAAPSDTTVCVGAPRSTPRCETQEVNTRFHYAKVTGLEPGTRYAYSLRSAGNAQLASATNPGTFTTLQRPPGRFLFEFAILSDTHIGEKCSGTATTQPVLGSVPPCFSSSGPPYAATMTGAAVDELNHRGVGLALLIADNTSHGKHEEAVELHRILERFSGRAYLARGSHDRAGQNPADPRCGAENDCFKAILFPDRPPGRIFYSRNYRGYHFVALDSAASDGTGHLNAEQLAFLERDLEEARAAKRKTFIFFHHPVSEYTTTTAIPPVVFGVRPDRGGREFIELIARFPNVVGVLNSHTHRNYVSYSPDTGFEVPYIENGAVKEYPGGYGLVRVHEGGYVRNFYRLSCEFCREWTSTTRDQYFGLYPLYTLGTLSARNFTHVYDCGVPTPPPSPPTGDVSAIGGDTAAACRGSGGDEESGTASHSCGGAKTTIVGSRRDDQLRGTARRDVIRAGRGDDAIAGRGARDVVCAGRGDDRLRGGNGRDRLSGGKGGDLLVGGAGGDRLRGQGGRDELRGGRGRDRLKGGRGHDDLHQGDSGP
jgi:hypothetical protein